ncbi:MAG: LacI family DNA-binding transcriptional regulator [Acidimicrobiia bacterium]
MAVRAGVSRTTASFVLNGRDEMRISDAASERVRRAARERLPTQPGRPFAQDAFEPDRGVAFRRGRYRWLRRSNHRGQLGRGGGQRSHALHR